MEEILKALKTLPKEYLQVIILELMKDQKISYEDITRAYVEYLDMLRKGTSEKFLTLQSKMISMYTGNVKDRKEQQMMTKAIVREVKVDAGGYPYIDTTELYDYDKDMPLAKEGDKVKVIILNDE